MYGFMNDAGMTEIGEGGSFDAAAYTVAPIAAILAPLTLGLICDRLINTERVLAILNIVGAALLWLAPTLAEAGAPDSFLSQFTQPMILCLLAYMLCFMPTLGLTASLSFKHLANSEKDFPPFECLEPSAGSRATGSCGVAGCSTEKVNIRKATTEFEQAKAAAGANETLNAAQQAFDTVMSTIQFSDNSPHIFHAAAIASATCVLPDTSQTTHQKGEPISVSKVRASMHGLY